MRGPFRHGHNLGAKGPSPNAPELRELDCALLGPQVAFEKTQFEPKFAEAGVPFAVIPMQDYGMVRGDKVMQMAFDMIEAQKNA